MSKRTDDKQRLHLESTIERTHQALTDARKEVESRQDELHKAEAAFAEVKERVTAARAAFDADARKRQEYQSAAAVEQEALVDCDRARRRYRAAEAALETTHVNWLRARLALAEHVVSSHASSDDLPRLYSAVLKALFDYHLAFGQAFAEESEYTFLARDMSRQLGEHFDPPPPPARRLNARERRLREEFVSTGLRQELDDPSEQERHRAAIRFVERVADRIHV